MRVMKECGVNVLGLTAMPWLYDFIKGPYIYSQPTEECNQNGDAMKYFLDIAREEGFMVNGWGQYPFNRFSVEEVYNWLTGSHATLERSSFMEISYDEPLLPAANSALWMYQFKRWGDLYFQTEDGAVPFDVEDTRGWMRMDINIRYPIGAATLTAFRNWLRSKYVSISRLNDAWGSAYASFDDIDPEKDATPNRFGHQYEYYDRSRIFHDWTPAMEDFDLFRSLVRVQNYSDTLREVRKQIPGAAICIRTEGGNYLVSGLDPESPNPHIRHVYYSQRRAAVIAEALQQSDTVKFHSDYVTMPYTPDEITYLTTLGVSQGIIPIQLPQFDHMRDIAVNDRYGYDYDVTYNLPEPAKGVMMHCLTAVFPWWKALYEAGGVPGATWEDFECDGIVFETQRREMKLFVKKLAESMNTPENRAARTRDVRQPDDSFRDAAAAKRSFVTDRSVLKIKEEGR
ncbi:MAG: beta-galactosidase [Abditibacteriota bacterium]|nr:beta-galactosidase [Abditibacteriota bacterium]